MSWYAYNARLSRSIIILAPPRLMLDPPQQMVRPGDSPLIICTMISGDQPAEIEWIKVCSNRNLRNIILFLEHSIFSVTV